MRISTGLGGFLGGSGRHTVGLTVAGAKGYLGVLEQTPDELGAALINLIIHYE